MASAIPFSTWKRSVGTLAIAVQTKNAKYGLLERMANAIPFSTRRDLAGMVAIAVQTTNAIKLLYCLESLVLVGEIRIGGW